MLFSSWKQLVSLDLTSDLCFSLAEYKLCTLKHTLYIFSTHSSVFLCYFMLNHLAGFRFVLCHSLVAIRTFVCSPISF